MTNQASYDALQEWYDVSGAIAPAVMRPCLFSPPRHAVLSLTGRVSFLEQSLIKSNGRDKIADSVIIVGTKVGAPESSLPSGELADNRLVAPVDRREEVCTLQQQPCERASDVELTDTFLCSRDVKPKDISLPKKLGAKYIEISAKVRRLPSSLGILDDEEPTEWLSLPRPQANYNVKELVLLIVSSLLGCVS